MLQAFVITLREGLEAFLIVAISLAYLKKTGRTELVRAVYWGIGISIMLSVAAGLALRRATNQALWEGVLAIGAALLVATLTVHMWRHAKRLKSEIQVNLGESAARTGRAAFLGVFAFILLMITREGMETALLFNAILFQIESATLFTGAVAGLSVAAIAAWSWSHFGHRINLGLFLQVTSVFLLVFLAQLLIYGFHELAEASVLPYSQTLHWATEPYGPDGRYGKYLSYVLVILPLIWLPVAALAGRPQRVTTTIER